MAEMLLKLSMYEVDSIVQAYIRKAYNIPEKMGITITGLGDVGGTIECEIIQLGALPNKLPNIWEDDE